MIRNDRYAVLHQLAKPLRVEVARAHLPEQALGAQRYQVARCAHIGLVAIVPPCDRTIDTARENEHVAC